MLRTYLLAIGLLATACSGTSASSADTSTGAPTDTSSTAVGTSSVTGEADAESGSSTIASDTTSDPPTTGDSSSTGEIDLPPAIALVQYDADAHFGDPNTNVAALTAWAEAAIDRGARIIVFPEGSTYGYASPTEVWCTPGMSSYQGRSCRDVSEVAEILPGGPTTDYWSAFAAEHDVTVVYHVPEREGVMFYTSLGVVDASGFVTRYRKRALYYVDQAFATPGDASVILETAYGRFGLMICLDGTYDGPLYDDYLAAGVDGIIIPMDWDDDPDGDAAAIEWFRERAFTNDVKIYAADVSTWDGTGLYLPGDVPRERDGLPPVAVGVDGVSVHLLP